MTRHPTVILAALGFASGLLGLFGLGIGIGDAPHPGVYMVLTGVWFGLAVGFGVWRWGNRSWAAAALALLATWIAWEVAVNLSMQLSEFWLKDAAVPEELRTYISGFAAGAAGALLTWAGAAASTPSLRRIPLAALVVATGAVLGLLLPWTNGYDSPAILLLPWQSAVAAALGLGLAQRRALGSRHSLA